MWAYASARCSEYIITTNIYNSLKCLHHVLAVLDRLTTGLKAMVSVICGRDFKLHPVQKEFSSSKSRRFAIKRYICVISSEGKYSRAF